MPLHEGALKACIEEMRSIVSTYRPEYAGPDSHNHTPDGEEPLDWYDRRRTACERIAEQLLKSPIFRAKYTKQALAGEMITVSQALLTCEDLVLAEEMTRAVELLETSQLEWRCLYPLSGIVLYDFDELPLGSTTIRLMTEQYVNDWQEEMEATLSQYESLSEDERETWRQNYSAIIGAFRRDQVTIDTTFPDRRQAQVYAEVRVIGDLHKAREIAEVEIRSVIDILRYACIPLRIFDSATARYVGLLGEYGQGPRNVQMIPSTYVGQGDYYTAGRMTPLPLRRERVGKLADWGVLDLGRFLRRPDSEYILDAVHWFAESLTQAESGHAFLCLAIGLETLFGQEQSQAWKPIAHGVAHVIGGDASRKKEVVEKMNGLYQVRNDVAHGRKRRVKESELTRMHMVVQQVVRGITRRANYFSPRLRLDRWIAEQEPIPDLYRARGQE